MRQGGGAGGSALSIWVRALAEGGEAAGEIKSDAAGHQSDWASGLLHPVIFRPAERERRAGKRAHLPGSLIMQAEIRSAMRRAVKIAALATEL